MKTIRCSLHHVDIKVYETPEDIETFVDGPLDELAIFVEGGKPRLKRWQEYGCDENCPVVQTIIEMVRFDNESD